jgi:hypothetical protein
MECPFCLSNSFSASSSCFRRSSRSSQKHLIENTPRISMMCCAKISSAYRYGSRPVETSTGSKYQDLHERVARAFAINKVYYIPSRSSRKLSSLHPHAYCVLQSLQLLMTWCVWCGTSVQKPPFTACRCLLGWSNERCKAGLSVCEKCSVRCQPVPQVNKMSPQKTPMK